MVFGQFIELIIKVFNVAFELRHCGSLSNYKSPYRLSMCVI